MQIKSIVATAAIALIASVGSVSADELSVADTAFNTGPLFALPAGVATPMSEAELDAVRGQGSAIETFSLVTRFDTASTTSGYPPRRWELFFAGSAIE